MTASLELPRLRPSTDAKAVASHEAFMVAGGGKSSRQILPLTETPSIVVDASLGRAINIEATQIKTSERIFTFYTDGKIQEVMGYQTWRGKTVLQGSQAPIGYQAAHHSLEPSLFDNSVEMIEKRIITSGVTPQKSGPYLKKRLDITSPEIKLLDSQHTDEDFVHAFIFERLPPRGAASAIAGTHFEKRRNATFENPDESNQFDCLLEKHIRPISTDLQKRRANKEISAKEATRLLVESKLKFYRESISNLQKCLDKLQEFHTLEKRLIAFENAYGPKVDVSLDLLQPYLNDVKRLLEIKEDFLAKQTGVHRWHDVMARRRDYYHLKHLVNYAPETLPSDLIKLYKEIRPSLITPTIEDISPHLYHYQLFLIEAQAQQREALFFESTEAINNLDTLIFGINDSGSRRAPSFDELSKQVFDMLKVSPIKTLKRKR